MAVEPHVYDVEIGGFSLKLKSNHRPDKVNKLIQLVESKVEESLKVHSNISVQKALILTCLNMAEEISHLKETAYHRVCSIESRIQSMSQLLESSKQKT